MPSVTMDRQILTIQMRKYSPDWPVNLSGTTLLAADGAASDGCATSPPSFFVVDSRVDAAASIDVRVRRLKEIRKARYSKKMTRPASRRDLNGSESNPILLRSGRVGGRR